MIINNLELIAPMMPLESLTSPAKYFCLLQIVCRAKDHKGEKIKEGSIATYYIKNEKHLRKIMPEVIALCELYGARAYINVSHKDFDKFQKTVLLKIASLVCEGGLQNPRKILNSAAGTITAPHPVWIIDVDDMTLKDSILAWCDAYFKIENDVRYYLLGTIPTKQGCHLLVRPFNLRLFSSLFNNVDVHKNSMGTLLYYPDSIKQD